MRKNCRKLKALLSDRYKVLGTVLSKVTVFRYRYASVRYLHLGTEDCCRDSFRSRFNILVQFAICKSVFRIRIHLFRIRIQHLRLNTDPDPGFWWSKNWKKIYIKKIFWYYFIKNCNYLSLGIHKGCPSYRRSLQPSKEKIQQFLNFFLFFGHFCPPGPGSTYLIDSGSGSETMLQNVSLQAIIDEFSVRVGQQAVVVVATPGKSVNNFKVRGNRLPLVKQSLNNRCGLKKR